MLDLESNIVRLVGKISGEAVYDHEVFGEKFYKTYIDIVRKSGISDVIPIIISERICDVEELKGRRVAVNGRFQSYNLRDGEYSRLLLFVFAREILFDVDEDDSNFCSLTGFVCKEPTKRITSSGRIIADVLLAVNRAYGRSDYIPCICWGRNAGHVSILENGTKIQIAGRIQSRKYVKDLGDEKVERVAYELSASKVKCCNDL